MRGPQVPARKYERDVEGGRTRNAFTVLALQLRGGRDDTVVVNLPPVSTTLPESIQSPADALAFIAVKKGMDAQKSAAVALLALLDPNLGTRLNVSA